MLGNTLIGVYVMYPSDFVGHSRRKNIVCTYRLGRLFINEKNRYISVRGQSCKRCFLPELMQTEMCYNDYTLAICSTVV